MRFDQCELRRCRFEGPLRDVWFDCRKLPDRARPRQLKNVDFARAVFSEVEFLGCSLNGVIPPDDPDVEVIRRYRCVIEHGLELLASTDKQAARMLRADFQNRLKMMRRTEEDNMFNLRDYRDGGEELAPLAQRVFAEAQRGCA